MKKQLLTLISCSLLYIISYAQTADYRTTEDGVTQLMNNVDFLDRMSKMSNQQLLDMNVQMLIDEYVPEYKGFKMELDKLDLNKVYYGGGNGYNTQQLANGLGKMLGMNEQETTNLNGVLSGQYNFTDVRQSGSYISNQLYQKGKHEGVDYVVDNVNGALQKQFGDGGTGSAVIDVGTGLLGNFLFNLTQEDEAVDPEKERQAKEAAARYEAYRQQQNSLLDKASEAEIYANKQAYAHNYNDAIKGYTDAINFYRQTEYGGYSVIKCYRERAKAKMEMNDPRAAIVDFYLGLNAFNDVANGKIKWTRNELSTIEEDVWGFVRGRAYAKYRAGDFNGALADCNLLISAMKKSDPKKADWKNGAVQYDPFSFMPQNTLMNDIVGIMGMSYIGLQKYAEAVEVLKYSKSIVTMQNFAIRLDELPRTFHREIMLAKTVAYYKTGNYTEALKHYDKYIECKQWISMQGGTISAGYSGRGNVYVAMGNYQAALADYNTAIELEPTEASYYVNRANCKLLLGDKEGAKQDVALFKNPAEAAAQKKTVNYYWEKFMAMPKANDRAVLELLDSADIEYPNTDVFLWQVIFHVNKLGDMEKINYYKNKYVDNAQYGPTFNAIALLHMKDTINANNALLQALEGGLSLETAIMFSPGIPNRNDYCNLLSKYIGNSAKNMNRNAAILKQAKDNITVKLNNVKSDNTANLSLSIQYLYIGDGENALKHIDEYLNNTLENARIAGIEHKIKALFMLARNQEAVELARTYYIKERNGIFAGSTLLDFVTNIAANHCGFSTLPPPKEPKESGKKKK